MVINLSDVLSEQHKPIDVTVSFELEAVSYTHLIFDPENIVRIV